MVPRVSFLRPQINLTLPKDILFHLYTPIELEMIARDSKLIESGVYIMRFYVLCNSRFPRTNAFFYSIESVPDEDMDCGLPPTVAPVFTLLFEMWPNQYLVRPHCCLEDLATLSGQEWINDQALNAALALSFNHHAPQDLLVFDSQHIQTILRAVEILSRIPQDFSIQWILQKRNELIVQLLETTESGRRFLDEFGISSSLLSTELFKHKLRIK